MTLEPEGGGAPLLGERIGGRARRGSSAASIRPRRLRRRAQVPASGRARVLPARVGAATATAEALAIVRTTLDRMADGGIHDQLGGGFCRYSRRRANGPSRISRRCSTTTGRCSRCTPTSRASPASGVTRTSRATSSAGSCARCSADDGAFYSSLDADSEGEEGKFYVWTPRGSARAAMTAEEWAVAEPYFGLDGPPNFEGHAWNLRVSGCRSSASRDGSPSRCPMRRRGSPARKAALFAARETRVRPGRDDKILTSWNALAIAGLARAATALGQPRWADLAFAAADALKRTAWRDGRLLATRRGDRCRSQRVSRRPRVPAGRAGRAACRRASGARTSNGRGEIADALLARFEDRERGGFFFTSHDHEKLFHRTKPGHDNATPSGNGVAAQALIAFGHLAGELRYVDAAERTVRLFAPALAESPGGHSTLLEAAAALDTPPASVLLRRRPRDLRAMAAHARSALPPAARSCSISPEVQRCAARARQRCAARTKARWPGCVAAATCLPPMTSLDLVLVGARQVR